MNELTRTLELLVGETNVGVAPKALREDAGGFARRRVVQVVDDEPRRDRKPPRPALTRRMVFGLTDDVHDSEDALPDRRVEDRRVAALDRRPA